MHRNLLFFFKSPLGVLITAVWVTLTCLWPHMLAAIVWAWVGRGFFSTCVCGTSGTRIDLGPAPAPQRVAFSWATASGLLSALLFTGSERAAPALRGVWGGFNVPGNSHCPRASRHNSLLNYGHKFLQRDGSSGLWGVDASVAEGSSHFF